MHQSGLQSLSANRFLAFGFVPLLGKEVITILTPMDSSGRYFQKNWR